MDFFISEENQICLVTSAVNFSENQSRLKKGKNSRFHQIQQILPPDDISISRLFSSSIRITRRLLQRGQTVLNVLSSFSLRHRFCFR